MGQANRNPGSVDDDANRRLPIPAMKWHRIAKALKL